MMMTTPDALDLSSLTDDGDTLELPDGRTLRLRITPDEYMSGFDLINDCDACGRLEWVDRRNYEYDLPHRPDDMDGNAEIIDRDRGSVLWWQPYLPEKADRRRWATDRAWRQEYRRLVTEMVEYGPRVVTLELLTTCDMGCEHVQDYASLGGVEPFPDDAYIVSLVGDLVGELEL